MTRILAGLALLLSSLHSSQPAPVADLVITGVAVIDVQSGSSSVRTVVIRNGVIGDLLPVDAPVPASKQTVDGRGKFLIPGLWDMHVHLAVNPVPNLAEQLMLPLFRPAS